ncbi:LysE family translocator [Affinibrenneria salicis]|uniref:LysE family translocator n=1 Tax=Affinibrenneria salicis TaxID=2590031 RepID=A0A5J5FUN4_9GAMM|nr:LysE family translocator [Affinibrenneria salicis]KAA8997376.1 LysE family translocator [Affinibrenneria salicis]
MVNSTLLLFYILSVFLLIITPGPVMAAVIHSRIQYGVKKAALTVAGTNFASLALMSLAIAIISGLFSLSALALHLLSLAGCGMIFYLALNALRRSSADAAPGRAATERSGWGSLLNGFFIGIANPKDILFFVAFFPQFIAITPSFAASVLILLLLWITLDLTLLLSVVFLLRGDAIRRRQRLIAVLSGLCLLLIAFAGMYSSVRALLQIRY